MSARAHLDDDVLHVAITGRVTPEAIETFAGGVDRALGRPGPFAVVFDRRTMTATTAEGRTALERWAETTLPRLPGRCAAWADVYDARRYASLRRHADDEPDSGYAHRTFVDLAEAATWARGRLDGASPAAAGG